MRKFCIQNVLCLCLVCAPLLFGQNPGKILKAYKNKVIVKELSANYFHEGDTTLILRDYGALYEYIGKGLVVVRVKNLIGIRLLRIRRNIRIDPATDLAILRKDLSRYTLFIPKRRERGGFLSSIPPDFVLELDFNNRGFGIGANLFISRISVGFVGLLSIANNPAIPQEIKYTEVPFYGLEYQSTREHGNTQGYGLKIGYRFSRKLSLNYTLGRLYKPYLVDYYYLPEKGTRYWTHHVDSDKNPNLYLFQGIDLMLRYNKLFGFKLGYNSMFNGSLWFGFVVGLMPNRL